MIDDLSRPEGSFIRSTGSTGCVEETLGRKVCLSEGTLNFYFVVRKRAGSRTEFAHRLQSVSVGKRQVRFASCTAKVDVTASECGTRH